MTSEDNKKQGLTDEAATVELFNINKHLMVYQDSLKPVTLQ